MGDLAGCAAALRRLLEPRHLEKLPEREHVRCRTRLGECLVRLGRGDEAREYYASLANQVRQAKFRYGRAEEVRVQEFRFEGDELAHVDVQIVGRHERAFRIRDIVIERTDTWRRSGDTWFLRPGRL